MDSDINWDEKGHNRQRQILSYEKTGRQIRWSISMV
jgi:hypothetical protein